MATKILHTNYLIADLFITYVWNAFGNDTYERMALSMQFRVMIATVAFVVFALSVDAAFSRKAEPVVSNFVNKFASEIRGAIKLEERYSEVDSI